MNWFQLCYIGLPCAGVLARELLERSQQHQKQIFNDKQQTSSNTVPFPRSEVIQNLSVFASYLENMRDIQDGNYGVAQKGLHAIRSVLDRILSGDDGFPRSTAAPSDIAVNPPSTDSITMAANQGDWSVNMPNLYPDDGNAAEFMAWLDNIDWAQESLLAFG